MGLGRLGGLPLWKGWVADRVSWVCSRGWVGLSGAGIGDTPAAACWVACLFSCACMCLLPGVGGGCGCVVGLGIKVFERADTLSGSRSTPCERLPPVGGGCPRSQPAIVGVGCVWWVVCDLYSGCEHICSVLFL